MITEYSQNITLRIIRLFFLDETRQMMNSGALANFICMLWG